MKWLAKVLLLAVIIIVFDIAVGKWDSFIYSTVDIKTNPDYITKISNCKDDILIIGSSTARHHYIPQKIQDSLGISVYNAGLDGAFFIFQNCVINYLLDNNTAPAYILWEIGDDCLSGIKTQGLEYQQMDILYPCYSYDYIHKAIDGHDVWQKYRMLSNMYRSNSNMLHDMLASINVALRGRPQAQYILDSCRGYNPLPNDGYVYPVMKCDSVEEFVDSERVDMLIQTIHKCKDCGVRLIFTSSPRYYDADLLSLKQARELRRIAQEENIPYLDYYHNCDIVSNNTYFKDNDHLNARGAEAYMDVFIPALNLVINDMKE